MGSITEPDHLPSISYADLQHEDTGIRDRAAGAFTQALRDYGACRIRDHGIPQDRLDMCFEKVSARTHPSGRCIDELNSASAGSSSNESLEKR